MAARAVGTGSISFGLVSIPVKMYPATQSTSAISFNMLHQPPCGSRLKQQYICAREEVIVPRDEMVKGYEFAKEQYVVFTPAELKALEERASQTIDITEFVPIDQVDPVYYDKPYFLAPEKGGDKAYVLLRDALQESGKVAITKVVIRTRQHLAAIKPQGKGLMLELMHFPHEILDASNFNAPTASSVSKPEMKMANQLINSMSSKWNPEDYKDEYREALEAMVERKLEGDGKPQPATPRKRPTTNVIDLASVLQRSIRESTQARKGKSSRKGAA